MSQRTVRLLCVALIGILFCAGAVAAKTTHKKKKAAEKPTGPTLIWRGDVASAQGVMDEVSKAWQKAGKGTIELQQFNTASGLDAVESGSADLAGSARNMAGTGDTSLTFTPVAWDAVVLITNPANPVSNLTLKQVHDIYLGKITSWSELGGNNDPIDLVAVASPGDGVEYSLRRLVFGRGNQPVAAPRLYVNTSKLEEGIGLDTKGLGASILAMAGSNSKLKILHINGVAPSASTVANGSYPLFTPIYLVTNPTSAKAAQTKEFVDFIQGDAGRAALRAHNVLPYADGGTLTAMDSSRRATILAETGGKAVAEPTATPVASAVAAAASPGNAAATAAAMQAKNAGANPASVAKAAAEAKQAVKAGATPEEAVAEALPPSLDKVLGDATTVDDARAHGKDFARVTAVAYVLTTAPAHTRKSAPAAKSAPKAATKTASVPAHGKTYTVAKGDTVYSISRRFAVDQADVRRWNGLKSNDVKLGQTLHVSAR